MALFKRKKSAEPQFYATVADGLKKIYRGKLLPLEEVRRRGHSCAGAHSHFLGSLVYIIHSGG